MADEIIRMQDIYAEDIVGNINEVREARGTFESLDARLDNIDGNAPSPSTSDPAMDGTASPGSADTYSRGDHVHPTDTSRQAVIDSSHKLSSDLVDDTNNTHKFATAAQLQQISTNETNISSILDGTTIDSFGDVETALSGKQATLTTAQLAAVNSGIDSAKVAQIETNKNNILSLTANGGGKNKLQITSASTSEMTINADKSVSITVNATTTKQYNLTNWIPNDYVGMKISGMTVDSNVSTGYFISAQYSNNGSSWTNETDIATIGSATILDYLYIRIAIVVREGNNLSNTLFKPMISADGGDYQPYAMSNAELTAAIQALQAQLNQ